MPAAPRPPLDPNAALHGTVLYIEDAPIFFAVVQEMLSKHTGVRLLHAATGIEGVRMALAEQPDLVLLDMHLPDISGLEVVRRLSEAIALHRFRVTLLTGDALSIDIFKAMSLGAYEYLTKPVAPAALEASLRRALGGRSAAPDGSRA